MPTKSKEQQSKEYLPVSYVQPRKLNKDGCRYRYLNTWIIKKLEKKKINDETNIYLEKRQIHTVTGSHSLPDTA